jgi:hypothetical protein
MNMTTVLLAILIGLIFVLGATVWAIPKLDRVIRRRMGEVDPEAESASGNKEPSRDGQA